MCPREASSIKKTHATNLCEILASTGDCTALSLVACKLCGSGAATNERPACKPNANAGEEEDSSRRLQTDRDNTCALQKHPDPTSCLICQLLSHVAAIAAA